MSQFNIKDIETEDLETLWMGASSTGLVGTRN
jgi:hypothetical protein